MLFQPVDRCDSYSLTSDKPDNAMKKYCLWGLLLLGLACRRPSTQLSATLTPTSPQTRPVSAQSSPDVADYSPNLKAGDEAIASGSNPTWSLTINRSRNKLRFQVAGSDSLSLPVAELVNDQNGEFHYETSAGSSQIVARFRPDSCVSATGQRADLRVDVAYKGKHYGGCGLSLRQLRQLQHTWVLKTLHGKAVLPGGPKNELPRLNIQLTEGSVTGTGGCNRLSGRVRADNYQVQLGPLMTTKMACTPETNRQEGDFLEALSRPLTYRIADQILTLFHENKPVMTFGKVD